MNNNKPLMLSLAAGGFSFFLLALTSFGVLSSLIALYAPALPLLLAGFYFGAHACAIAALAATVLSFTMLKTHTAIFLIIMMVLPAVFIVSRYLSYEKIADNAALLRWYPVGKILAGLAGYSAVIFLMASVYYSGEGGVEGLLKAEFNKAIADFPPELTPMIQTFAASMIYLIPFASSAIWLAILFLYSVIAHFTLSSYGIQKRSNLSFAFGALELPSWLLPAVILPALAVVITDGQVLFASKVVVSIMLIPYMISGITMIHRKTVGIPGRFLILFVMYTLLFRLWPAIAIALIAVALHLREIFITTRIGSSRADS